MSRKSIRDLPRVCEVCGKTYYVPRWYPKHRPARWCSRSCVNRGRVCPSLEDRFWPKVRKSDGCWEWTGNKRHGGYGVILKAGAGTRQLVASRVSWEIHHGPIPEGLIVCHRCDNPICVRPDHLFLGTKADNTADMIAKGRQVVGEATPISRANVAIVKAVRTRYASGGCSQQSLADEFGLARGTVQAIVERKTWKHVE